MTTGATGQLGLALPVQGELSGTWGDTVNNGITQYTNIAIAGTLTLTGDGAVTLANTTGDASASNITSTLAGAGTVTAQFAIVKVSGTTTTKVVTGPSYSKTYVVDNASSFAVTFKASGQTGVSVAAAEKVTVVFNGTDYIKLAGTIANAAGSNTQIQFNNGGLFGASANLTWDGTTLSSTQVNITGQGTLRLQDTTGGEYVGLRSPSALGASYTLTFPADDGTSGQALITDGSGVLSWSTAASGDVYGPASSTDNAVARFDSTTGKLLQNSVVIVGDTGDVSGVGTLSATTLTLTNALGTAYGGTNLTSFTSGGVVYASSTSALATGSGLTFDGTTLAITGPVSSTRAGTANYVLNDSSSSTSSSLQANSSALYFNANTGAVGAGSFIWRSSSALSELMRLTSTGLGIGTSSPAYKLDVTGAIRATTNLQSDGGQVILNNATANYLYFKNATPLYISDTIGNVRATIDSAGNVGIGTSSPGVKLDVAGAIRLTGNVSTKFGDANEGILNGTQLFPASAGLTSFGAVFGDINASSGITLYGQNHATKPSVVEINTISGNKITYSSSGNLGLGVTPSAWESSSALQMGSTAATNYGYSKRGVLQNAYFDGSLFKYFGTGGATYYQPYNGSHVWATAASGTAGNTATFSTTMTLDASGNLGLGVTPSAWVSTYKAFELFSSGCGVSSDAATKIQLAANFYRVSGADKYGTTGEATLYSQASGVHKWFNAPSGTAGTNISFTQAMTLDTSGNLMVGTTSGSDKLNIAGNATLTVTQPAYGLVDSSNSNYKWIVQNISSALRFYDITANVERARITSTGDFLVGLTSTSTATGGTAIFKGADSGIAIGHATGSTAIYTYFQYNGTTIGSVSQNGTTGVLYNITSDQRLKENIQDADSASSLIDSLQVRKFDWKTDRTHQRYGFVAQELVTVAPEAVYQPTDTDEMMAVDYSKLVPMLVKEIQSLRQRVAQLETN